jgi:hypothetical protein
MVTSKEGGGGDQSPESNLARLGYGSATGQLTLRDFSTALRSAPNDKEHLTFSSRLNQMAMEGLEHSPCVVQPHVYGRIVPQYALSGKSAWA